MSIVCLSPGGPGLYATDSPSRELLVGTLDGVILFDISGPGLAAEIRRRSLRGMHVSALMSIPDKNLIFAGTHGSGLYVSGDGGRTWERRDHGIRFSDIYTLNFVRAGEELRLYAGTEPAHLFVSRDSGHEWQEVPSVRGVPSVEEWNFPAPPHLAHVKNIAFDPRSPETIYVSVEQGAALKSQDGGRTWRQFDLPTTDIHRVVIVPSRPDHLYITGNYGILHSRDGGDTWSQLTDRFMRVGYPDPLFIHPDRHECLFAAGARTEPGTWRDVRTADSAIVRSDDEGRTWRTLDQGLPEHIHGNIGTMSMNRWRGGFCLFAGDTDGDIFASSDEGEHWSVLASDLPPVCKGIHYKVLPKVVAGRSEERPLKGSAVS